MARRKGSNPEVTGGRHKTIHNNRERVYEALKRKYGVRKAAKIANAGHTREQRKRMAKKAARTRKRRGE